MFIKTLPGIFLALFCVVMPLPAANDNRTIVTLRGNNVAAIICSERNDHLGFHMPLAPQFTEQKLNEYPALYKTLAATLTTGSLVRFIEQSPTLFADWHKRENYKRSLKNCIDAHKACYKNNSKAKRAELRAAEDEVFDQLINLDLKDDTIRAKLEKILSTPTEMPICKLYNSFVLPNRAWVAQQEGGEFVIKRSHPTWMTIKQVVASAGACIIPLLCTLFLIEQVAGEPMSINDATKKTATAAGEQEYASYKTTWDQSHPTLYHPITFMSYQELKPGEKFKDKSMFITEELEKAEKAHKAEWEQNHPKLRNIFGFCGTLQIALALMTLYHGISKARTSFKLTPEPGNGIKVVINYLPPKPADEKA